MTALVPHAFGRIPSRLHSLLWRTSNWIPVFPKSFSTSLMVRREDTPAMKALRDIPYIATPPDNTLFEDYSGEYTAIKILTKDVSAENVAIAGETLGFGAPILRLVKNRQFKEADLVRAELVEMGVPIEPHYLYYHAAENILKQPHFPDRTRAFSNWWSLIPPVSKKLTGNFATITRHLFFSNRIDIPTIYAFAVISAEKGYARRIAPLVIGFMARLAEPAVTMRFLEEFSQADRTYCEGRKESGGSFSYLRGNDSRKRWWSVAIRTHCTARRPEEAFNLLKAARQHNIGITGYTYSYVLGELEAKGFDAAAASVKDMVKGRVLEPAKKSLPGPPAASLLPLPAISRSQSIKNNLAIALRMLKRAITSDYPPSARELAAFFDAYKLNRRGGHAINLLRTRAFRFSRTAISVVEHAELLHHFHRQEYTDVLYIFQKFFHMISVPQEDVLQLLPKRQNFPPHMRIRKTKEGRLPAWVITTTFNMPDKLWPMSYHSAIVWNALVNHCATLRQLVSLYNKLLAMCTIPIDVPIHRYMHSPSPTPTPSTGPVIAPVEAFSAAHFTGFIEAFCRFQELERAVRVLEDMRARGIHPNLHNLIVLVGQIAKQGNPQTALDLLNQIRERRSVAHHDATLDGGERESEEERVGGTDSLRHDFIKSIRARRADAPVLIAYTTVMRGFVDRRLLDHARAVEVALVDHLGYTPGSSPQTDEVIQWLRRVEGLAKMGNERSLGSTGRV
ncbi:hypothetical protein EW146_g3279 [Bondarzewia mesenterica]|uniref:Pentacotripeptide-repeat region of PRORP domain-containing protein n=1 Tax=Bondarzewia mesenterica TaxID=1095465 RepID=A0A4S4LZI0_9AGAM|nr:hypothetical protein EW146_g3279 [Bondarzewia mesenterica]